MTSTFGLIYINTQLFVVSCCLSSDNMPCLQKIEALFVYRFCEFDEQMRATVL